MLERSSRYLHLPTPYWSVGSRFGGLSCCGIFCPVIRPEWPGYVRGDRCGGGVRSLASSKHREEGFDHLGVELDAGAFIELGEDVVGVASGAVGAVGGHGVVGVGDR